MRSLNTKHELENGKHRDGKHGLLKKSVRQDLNFNRKNNKEIQ
jgi:hypothetical protein